MSETIRLSARRVSGLKSEVSISVDRWGVCHIRAENLHDLFLAQGWNAARDRLWQIDIARKRGLGLLAQDFGPGFLAQDRAARLFLYRGGMDREWAAYGSDAEQICVAFTDGINAYIDACDTGEIPLPPEYGLLGNRPARWKAEDVVRVRTHALTRNATSEVLRARVMALAGPERGQRLDRLRMQLSHGVVPRAADGFDPACITDAVLRDFLLATNPATFSPQRLAAGLDEADRWTAVAPSGEVACRAFAEGSNNWAVAAQRTATGRPVLALDPHRTHVLPSIRYVVHLTMPGLDVIGAGEPMVPGISMGHNGTAAFGLTIFGADQEDVYVYGTKPGDPELHAYAGGWERFETIVETIPVKGYADQQVRLSFTRHGPVLHRDTDNCRAFALRSVWMDAGMAPYMASLSVMRAKTYGDYARSLEGWGCPSVNHIYADTGNTIAWKPSGATPVRTTWDGLLPVPGDGRYEWQGYLAPERAPFEVDPARGFIATANAMNVPPGWSAANPAIGYEWLDSSRHDMLHRELGANAAVSLEDCVRLQCATFSSMAARVLAWLKSRAGAWRDAVPAGGDSAGPEPAPPSRTTSAILALALFDGWDGDLAAASAPAALFEVWFSRHLGRRIAIMEGASPEAVRLLMPFDPPSLLEWLEDSAPETVFATVVAPSLADAWQDCAALMGQDAAGWAWGRIHRLGLDHPLQSLTGRNWSMPSLPLGGSSSTLNYGNYRLDDFSVVAGPSVRMVIDVGGWDNSLFVNMPGQSGAPGAFHYDDLLASWHEGRYCPLLYSRDAVDAATAQRIVLQAAFPAPAKTAAP